MKVLGHEEKRSSSKGISDFSKATACICMAKGLWAPVMSDRSLCNAYLKSANSLKDCPISDSIGFSR